MTIRHSDPRPGCPYCKGSGLIIASRDPDIDEDCICTEVEDD